MMPIHFPADSSYLEFSNRRAIDRQRVRVHKIIFYLPVDAIILRRYSVPIDVLINALTHALRTGRRPDPRVGAGMSAGAYSVAFSHPQSHSGNPTGCVIFGRYCRCLSLHIRFTRRQ